MPVLWRAPLVSLPFSSLLHPPPPPRPPLLVFVVPPFSFSAPFFLLLLLSRLFCILSSRISLLIPAVPLFAQLDISLPRPVDFLLVSQPFSLHLYSFQSLLCLFTCSFLSVSPVTLFSAPSSFSTCLFDSFTWMLFFTPSIYLYITPGLLHEPSPSSCHPSPVFLSPSAPMPSFTVSYSVSVCLLCCYNCLAQTVDTFRRH